MSEDRTSLNQMGEEQPEGNPPEEEKMVSEGECQTRLRFSHHMLWLSGIVGSVVGAVVCAALIFFLVLPNRVILTYPSQVGFDETIAALQPSIRDSGWLVTSVSPLCGAAIDANDPLLPRVTLVSMCKPEYAGIVLRDNPHIAAMMPCTFAVWEAKDGKAYVSVMNTTLMARLFGGRVGDVMGHKVAWDEKIILGDIIKNN
jgi:uncharacterized protein (DUF302 family)